MEDVNALAELRLFALAPRHELVELAESAWWVEHQQGAAVYTRGDDAGGALLLVRGRMRAQVGRPDATPHASDIWPGEVLGEAALFGINRRRTATVEAVTDCRCLELTPEFMQQLAGTEVLAILQRQLMHALARRLRTTDLAIRQAWQADHAAQAARSRPLHAARRPPTLRERLSELLGGIL